MSSFMTYHLEPTDEVTISPTSLNCKDERQVKLVGSLQVAFASLSLLGALSLIIFLCYRRVCAHIEVRPLFHLVSADACLAISLIISSSIMPGWLCTIFQIVGERGPTSNYVSFETYMEYDCQKTEAEVVFYPRTPLITKMCYLMTFLLTANYALNFYVRMKDLYHKANNRTQLREQKWIVIVLRTICGIAWVGPALIMVPGVVKAHKVNRDYTNCSCISIFFRIKPNDDTDIGAWQCYGSIIFVIILLLSLTVIIVLYVMSSRVHRQLIRHQTEFTDRQRSSLTRLQRRSMLYVLVFLFCWTPAFILAVGELYLGYPPSIEDVDVLYIIQSITSPSQGILNSLVYGWTKRSFVQQTGLLSPRTYRVYGATKQKFPQVPKPNQPAVPTEETTLDQR